MAKETTYTCDVCGKRKGETNHWFIGSRSKSTVAILRWDALTDLSDPSHLCGQACVTTYASHWMEER